MNKYEFIAQQENRYQTTGITVVDGWEWSMYKHIQLTVLYKNSQYSKNNGDVPFRNIIRALLNLQYRAEGFDLKDIFLYVNDAYQYFKSFLLRKYYERWGVNEEIDTYIDEIVESYVDFGGALTKKVVGKRPEVVPLQSIAFCDQTDILAGPLALKYFYSPDELKENKKWKNLDDAILLSQDSKESPMANAIQTPTPGKYVEVYELHGILPNAWLGDREDLDVNDFSRQMHVVCMYKDKDGKKQGITLYEGKEEKNPFKMLKRDPIYGRALGLGGAEELFESQVWANYSVIQMKGLLDQISKIFYWTDDQRLKNNNTSKIENGQFLTLGEGKRIGQVNNTAFNMVAFENSITQWQENAKEISSSTDALLGEQPTAGIPFKLQNLLTYQGQSIHEYRKGKISTFLVQIHKDWIIPMLAKEISSGKEFISELSIDEMQQISDALVTCKANDLINEGILNGQDIMKEDIELYKEKIRNEFLKGGNKKFMEILKDEFSDQKIDVDIDIAGKQKNMNEMVDKIVNIFSQILKNPQILQDPNMAKIFNQILEYSGLSPLVYTPIQPTQQQPIPQTSQPQISPQQISPQQLQNNQPVMAQ